MKRIEHKQNEKIGECIFLRDSKQVKNIRYAIFKCKCGKDFEATIQNVRSLKSKSCGCQRLEKLSIIKTTHGFTKNGIVKSEYSTWISIKSRCRNYKDPNYKRYGARGIDVCEQWFNSFKEFILYMKEKPTPYHSIDRLDNDGNYEPGNCIWNTKKEQCRNTRRNLILEYKGQKKCLSEWVEELGLTNYRAILKRIVYRNWSVKKAFETPIAIQKNLIKQ